MAFRQLKSQGGNYVKWDTPKTVKGRLVGFQKGRYKDKDTVTVILVQDDGTQIKVNGTSNMENAGLYNEQPGVVVELVFKGKKTGKSGNVFADIDVFVDSPEPEPGANAGKTAALSTQTGESESYETLVARLQLANPNGAKAVLAALDGMNLAPEAKAIKLREFLKVQG